jgi:uncharacterized protein YndB with AHSA1/START domain
VTYDLRIERMFDAPPDIVFDTLVDPSVQDELFADLVQGWRLRRFEIDLRVGGTWTIVYGPAEGEGEADTITSVFTQIERPHRLVYDSTMYVSEWGRTVEFTEAITVEDQGGKTLVTIEQTGFESEADRDSFEEGTPTFLEGVQRVVARRLATGGSNA